jgi:hypothetical protein
MQIYNLGIDEKTHKPSLDVRYRIEKAGKLVLELPEWAGTLSKASQQFTIARTIGLQSFTPGKYTVQVQVTDNINHQTISPSAPFELR